MNKYCSTEHFVLLFPALIGEVVSDCPWLLNRNICSLEK